MTKQHTAALGVFGFLAVIYLIKPRATVTTSETFDLSGIGATGFSKKIKAFAQAIAAAEGFWVGGSIPQRANNPGDLKLPNTSYRFPNGQASTVSVFASDDEGWTALHRQLAMIANGASAYYDLGMTIEQMGYTYAAGDPAWARNVAQRLGVSTDTPLWTVLA